MDQLANTPEDDGHSAETLGELSKIIRDRNAVDAYAHDKEWRGPFCFVQGADPQFGMIDQWDRKKTNPDEIQWEEDMQLMRKAVQDINRVSPIPGFFVVCGDLVHEFDVNPLKMAQERDLLRILSDIDPIVPIVLIPGNHDILNTPTSGSVKHFEEVFGPEYYSFDARGLRCICINSQYLKDFPEESTDLFRELREKFLAWFDGEIDKAAADLKSGAIEHAVVFQHIAWFMNSPDEPTDYFNVDFEIRQKYLKKLIDAGIKACFCGHLHRNGGGIAGPNGELDVVITSAIGLTLELNSDGQLVRGKNPSGLRLVKVDKSKIEHAFYPLGEMPDKVDLRH
ncbi:serine/threonine-protein phosphatase CPPED1-like [Paramacrobiotus metropolitanus]|uniref:serine/threonine-protein phosphatase CPPED1-like n=1 Tax=Paramacrobiotus metropolitanus TaxID=2943436 RepID=UPI002445B016|nr:serine/threonine-protein phosphatase CPPED1-like [Paramacrobiotus metropolitanus]